jgi:hypothetical protein
MTDTTEQAPPWQTKPTKEHEWLRRLVGEWTYESEAYESPDAEPHRESGRETVRAFGDVWVIAEGEGAMPDGSEHRSVLTLGFDPQQGRFVGTWIGSAMAYLWHYRGELDNAGNVLALHSDGPSMSGAGTAKYKDVIEIIDDDHRVFSGHIQDENGDWQRLMSMTYTRAR